MKPTLLSFLPKPCFFFPIHIHAGQPAARNLFVVSVLHCDPSSDDVVKLVAHHMTLHGIGMQQHEQSSPHQHGVVTGFVGFVIELVEEVVELELEGRVMVVFRSTRGSV